MKKLLSFVKNIVVTPFVIYLYDLIASPLNLFIPINIFTVLIIGVLGIPGLIMLIVLYLVLV